MVVLGAGFLILLVYLGFNAGGFFPDTSGLAIVAMLVALAVFVTTAERPTRGFRGRLAIGVLPLAAYGIWQLVSASWSHAPGRAALASQLTLLYVVAAVVAGMTASRPGRARALLLGLLSAMFAVSVAGLLSRTLPHVFPVAANVANSRLSYPTTYWNASGIIAAAAAVLCVGLTGSGAERPAVRVLTAAAVPALTTTVLFTFSRGALAAGTVGVVLAMGLAPRRHLIPGLLAVLPPAIVALVVAYDAAALARPDPTTATAVAQGHRVILVVALASAAAGFLRWLLLRLLDRRLDGRPALSRRRTAVASVAVFAVACVVAIGVSVPARLHHAYERFVNEPSLKVHQDLRTRLTDPANNGRLDHWRAAIDGFRADPVRGTGAGTYQNLWNLHRHSEFDVVNAHSLYLESLGETGIVGLALLVVALLALLAGALARTRGPDRALWATIAAAMIAWLLETGVDWIWQMPAASLWFFALGGAALARAPARGGDRPLAPLPGTARLVAALAILLVAISPVRIVLSQRHLGAAVTAMDRGDCRAAVSDSVASLGAFGARAEPFELLGYCDARLGYGQLSIAMVERAIARDPENWEYRYDLGLVRGAAGKDPRPTLAEAHRLNPLSGLVIRTQRAMASDRPQTWRRRAREARLLLPST